MNRPISVNGTATTTTAPAAAASCSGLAWARVNSAAITTTGSSEQNVPARPARIRPASRGVGPAGRVRTYGSHGWARSSETPTPYENRLLVITAKQTIEAVAKVAPSGSRPTNGTTKKSID